EGLRILVVEDNFLVAELICDVLSERGCDVVGPASSLDRGWKALDAAEVDGALLDINLDGTLSFPIADRLSERGIPFLFLTGYEDVSVLPPKYRTVQRITKPFDAGELLNAVKDKFAGHRL